MLPRTLLVFALLAVLCSTGWTKKKQQSQAGEVMIVEVSAVAITVDVGQDTQKTYKITDETKTTLDGSPANPGDLMAGMEANVTLAADGETVTQLDAKNPPAKKK
jgi:hypothetical protein